MVWLTGYVTLAINCRSHAWIYACYYILWKLHYHNDYACNPVIGETLWGVSAHQTKIWSSCTYTASHPRVRHLEQGRHRSHYFAPKQEWQPVLHHPHWLFLQVDGGSSNAYKGGKARSRLPLQDDTAPWLPSGDRFRSGPGVLQPAGTSPWRANRLQAQDYQCLSPSIQWPWQAFQTLKAQLQKLVNDHQTIGMNSLTTSSLHIARVVTIPPSAHHSYLCMGEKLAFQ